MDIQKIWTNPERSPFRNTTKHVKQFVNEEKISNQSETLHGVNGIKITLTVHSLNITSANFISMSTQIHIS